MLREDTEASQRGEGCSTAKEGGPFSFITSPFPAGISNRFTHNGQMMS